MNSALAQKRNIQYCTYSVGSVQYLFSAAHANLVNKYSKKLHVTPAFCGAETASVKLLGQGRIEFGEVCNLELDFARKGEYNWEKIPEAERKKYVDNIRAVFFEEYGSCQMITLAKSSIYSFKDIKGKKGSLGSAQCTSGGILYQAFEFDGVKPNEFVAVRMSGGSGQAPDRTADGTLDFYFTNCPGAQPSTMNIAVNNKIRMFGFSSKENQKKFLDYMEKKYGPDRVYIQTQPPKLYGPNQVNTEPVDCIAYDLVIATHAGMDDETVYEFTKHLFDHLPEFYEMGGPYAKIITLEKAMTKVHFPFHPGALKYYREKGLIK
jgi:TRAP transporter TAXI family solute receptor